MSRGNAKIVKWAAIGFGVWLVFRFATAKTREQAAE